MSKPVVSHQDRPGLELESTKDLVLSSLSVDLLDQACPILTEPSSGARQLAENCCR